MSHKVRGSTRAMQEPAPLRQQPGQGAVKDTRGRLVQYKTNIDVVMSLLDRNGLGDWLADRLADFGDTLRDAAPLRMPVTVDPFLDDRLPRTASFAIVRNELCEAGETAMNDRVAEEGVRLRRSPNRMTGCPVVAIKAIESHAARAVAHDDRQ